MKITTNHYEELMKFGDIYDCEILIYHKNRKNEKELFKAIDDIIYNYTHDLYIIVNEYKHFEILRYSIFNMIVPHLNKPNIYSFHELISDIEDMRATVVKNFDMFESKMLEEKRNKKIDNLLK